MDPIAGEELEALNKIDREIGKANRRRGKVSEYSEIPHLQAMGPTWRLHIPADLITVPKTRPRPAYLTALIREAYICGADFPRRDQFGFSANRGYLIDDDFDTVDEDGADGE